MVVDDRSAVAAQRAWWGAMAVALLVFVVVGRHQWFVRDDWAVLISRKEVFDGGETLRSYFIAQDGHFMAFPVLVYQALDGVFGLGSYWPFLAVCLAAHVAIVVLVRRLCLQVGVRPWTATLVCSILLVLGSGWENIVFAIQITFNFSLLAFLVHLVLVDHDGPADRRDVLGTVVAVLGVASSGFGPVFVAGVTALLVIRRRWIEAVIAAVPSALLYLWWLSAYGDDQAAATAGRPLSKIPVFVDTGVTAVFAAVTPLSSLVGVSILGSVAVLMWRARDPRAHDLLVVLAGTMVAMFVGIGVERAGFGVETAASSRYVYMGAVLVVPMFALALDLLGRLGRPALLAGWVLVLSAVVVQAGELYQRAGDWSAISRGEQHQLALIAGATLPASFDPDQVCLAFSPDVRCEHLPDLVARGAITPVQPATEADRVFLDGLADGVVLPAPGPTQAPTLGPTLGPTP
ncbi:MAG: hypothetical protein ABIO83_02105 [Ilumatobacteraceae bacterium]